VAFGPDGMLYLGLGDGGAANDRFGNGQRPDTLLGTVLRLDVSAGDGTYAIPPDNPYADGSGGAPEVWMYGLRNPYRFAFDESRIYIADVGQNAVEEVDVLPADTAGANLGWPVLEGSDCFASSPCDADGTVLPTVEYRHADTGGCAVIGGEVYAGEVAPLRGHYFFGDLCAGFVRSLTVADDGTVTEIDWTPQIGAVDGLLSFGKDAAGEIYLTTQDGRVLRLSASLPG
jgi:glucose/arabinose dehydrogenase